MPGNRYFTPSGNQRDKISRKKNRRFQRRFQHRSYTHEVTRTSGARRVCVRNSTKGAARHAGHSMAILLRAAVRSSKAIDRNNRFLVGMNRSQAG